MRIFPDRSRNYKIKGCVCGETNESLKVNKNMYHNTIFLSLLSVPVILGFPWVSLHTDLGTKGIVAWGLILIVLGFYTYGTTKLLGKGHSLLCSVRRTMINFGALT